MDEATRSFFQKLQDDPENQACVDMGTASPQWASVSHGCFICMEASGVHRSLGVHISFVRSTTMDAWKPHQLKLMELGGNARLKAFFREQGVPDDLPISQKYSTRAAEWYRRHLRALVDGTEPPEPLPVGTGHLQVDNALSPAQIAFAKAAAAGSAASPNGVGAGLAGARLYGAGLAGTGGSNSAGASPTGSGSASGRRRMEGFGGGAAAPSPWGAATPSSSSSAGGGRRKERSLCAEACDESGQPYDQDAGGEDFMTGLGTRVSASTWTAVGLVGSLAGRAKTLADSTVAQAKSEGWWDSAFGAARQGVTTAVDTTNWAVERGAEVINDTSGQSISAKVESSFGWVASQLGGTEDRSAGLSQMSTGTMTGFGSDAAPMPAPPEAAVPGASPAATAAAAAAKAGARCGGAGPAVAGRVWAQRASSSDGGAAAAAANAAAAADGAPPPPPPSRRAMDLWNDDDWGAWH